MRYWTCHWQNRYWRGDVNEEFTPVCSSGSNMFRKHGVSVGDVAYIISILDGYLLLGGRMTVKRIVSRDEAVRIRGRALYDADEWIIGDAADGTRLDLHRRLDAPLAKRLRFLSSGGVERTLYFREARLDGQTTRGVKELTPASAAFLDQIIEATDHRPRSEKMLTVTEALLHGVVAEKPVTGFHTPQEVRAAAGYDEGAVERVLVNRYERDVRAREECIAQHGAKCVACGFDFGEVYGDAMAGFIHVHHRTPLSSVGPGYRVNPIEDLCPICPNCHATVHAVDPPRTLEQVRRLLREAAYVSGDVLA